MSCVFMEIMRFIVAEGDPRVVGTKVPCAGVLGPFGATRWLWIAWLLRNSRAGRSAGACSSPPRQPNGPPANRSANAASRSALATLHQAGAAFRARVAKLGARFAPAVVYVNARTPVALSSPRRDTTPAPYREQLQQNQGTWRDYFVA